MDFGSKNVFKLILVCKFVDFFGVKVIFDIIDFFEKVFELKIEVGSEIYVVLLNFGVVGKLYLIVVVLKGLDLVCMVFMRVILICVCYEKMNYLESGIGDIWFNDEDVKWFVLNGCKDEIF